MKPVFLLKIYSILWNDYNEIRGKRKSFFNTGFSFQKFISKNFVYFYNLTYLNEKTVFCLLTNCYRNGGWTWSLDSDLLGKRAFNFYSFMFFKLFPTQIQTLKILRTWRVRRFIAWDGLDRLFLYQIIPLVIVFCFFSIYM